MRDNGQGGHKRDSARPAPLVFNTKKKKKIRWIWDIRPPLPDVRSMCSWTSRLALWDEAPWNQWVRTKAKVKKTITKWRGRRRAMTLLHWEKARTIAVAGQMNSIHIESNRRQGHATSRLVKDVAWPGQSLSCSAQNAPPLVGWCFRCLRSIFLLLKASWG